MTYATPTAEDLGLYLGLPEVEGDRADLLIRQAAGLAAAVVSPLPDGAEAVVLSAAGRQYVNPGGATYETVGPVSVQRPAGGLYLTRDERRSLKLLAGRGGAFTVDPTPADVDPWVSWPPDDHDRRPGWPWVDVDDGWGG